MPILTGTDGAQKMSKSLGNYIGISESPATMFDKIMRMADSNIINYFTLLTDISESDIAEMQVILENKPPTEFIIDCKKKLAFEILQTYHSAAIAEGVVSAYGKLDKEGLPELSIADIVSDRSTVNLPAFMKEQLGVSSLTEARRLIRQGAVSLNGEKLAAEVQDIALKQGDIFKFGKTKIVRLISN
jgi:tyrosyl-tRNA synthetase